MTLTQEERQESMERVDFTRFVLGQDYRWAKRVLRNLKLVELNCPPSCEPNTPHRTLAVDQWARLYVCPTFVSTLTEAELRGVVWHECNHLLRKHPERLADVAEQGKLANIAADCEINSELREFGVEELPNGVMYPEMFDMEPRHAAEDYYVWLTDRMEEEREQRAMEEAQQGEDGGEEQQQGSDSGGQGEQAEQSGSAGADGPSQDQATPGDGGEQDDTPGHEGTGSPSSDPAAGGAAGSVSTEGTPNSQAAQGDEAGDEDLSPGSSADPADNLPDPQCGSGGGGDNEEELPEPDPEEQARFNREMRHQDIDITEAVEQNGEGYSAYSPTKGMYERAFERLGRSVHDWRKTIGQELRTAMEQSSDEAEDFTFSRPSRRQASFPDAILPASYRPIPDVHVVVDVSGSMNEPKLTASFRELCGIMERLAIPEFVAHAWSSSLERTARIRTLQDAQKLYSGCRGSSTDMVAGIRHAITQGAEVVVVLTDAQCRWADTPTGVPLIIGGINRKGTYAIPKWVRVVDVEGEGS